ncbi:MAG: superoxide dismutase family protein [Ruminococcaceae bacterium]|nr:superoxide dismutase family protein [Oscillospiraceae bacterium]
MNRNFAAAAAEALVSGGGRYPRLRGRVLFIPDGRETLIIADISGLPESQSGFFALHIHEGDSCEGEGFPNTGNHYNPTRTDHPRHAGDLPPLLSNGGNAYLAVATGRFSVKEVIGKTVVIHSGTDDFRTQPAGAAGEKIACGVIKKL